MIDENPDCLRTNFDVLLPAGHLPSNNSRNQKAGRTESGCLLHGHTLFYSPNNGRPMDPWPFMSAFFSTSDQRYPRLGDKMPWA